MRLFVFALLTPLLFFTCGSALTPHRHWQPQRKSPALSALLNNTSSDTVFIPVPLIRQARNYTCGAAALQSMLDFFGDDLREGQLQRLLGSDPQQGTSYLPMRTLVEQILNDPNGADNASSFPACEEDTNKSSSEYQSDCVQGKPAVEAHPDTLLKPSLTAQPRDPYTIKIYEGLSTTPTSEPLQTQHGESDVPSDGLTSEKLEEYLRAGTPVMVMIQAWPDDPSVAGWQDGWSNGHFAVAVGFDADNFYFMDPSTAGEWTYIERSDFYRRWHDVDSHKENGAWVDRRTKHFALILTKQRAFDFYNDALPNLD